MSIRIIPQDELEKSEKRATDMIPPLLFPRLKNLYNRRAERLRQLAENNPLGDYLRPRAGSGAVRPSAADGSHRAHQRSERPG